MCVKQMLAAGLLLWCCSPGVETFSPVLLPAIRCGWQIAMPDALRSTRDFQRKFHIHSGISCTEEVDGDRHPIYWIEEREPNEGVVPLALKHNQNLPRFLQNRPVAPYNKEAFEAASKAYEAYCEKVGRRAPIVLDSCCGTGRSTATLAALRPESFVVGIDKSLVRLERNKDFRDAPERDNMVLVRANCVDFWRCAWEAGWEPAEHFILYPNPYPKDSQLHMRWHGSPTFPILLNLGGRIQVRASWCTYLLEMSLAADAVKGTLSSVVDRIFANGGQNEHGLGADMVEGPLSNFEIKYIAANQPVHRLRLPHLARVSPGEVLGAQL